MPPKGILVVATTAIAIWTLSGCGPSLESVKMTAGLGTQLSAHADAFDNLAGLCALANNGTSIDSHCEDLFTDRQLLRPVTNAIVAYANALAAMADDSNEPDYTSNVSATLQAVAKLPATSGLSAGVIKGTSGIANAILRLSADGYRREHLGEAIRSTNDIWKDVRTKMDALTKADLSAMNSIKTMLLNNALALNNALSPSNVAMRFSELDAITAVEASMTKLQAYQKSIDDFVAAHDELNKKVDTLGDADTDKELLKEILNDVGPVVASIASSAASATSAPSEASAAPSATSSTPK
jgi:hypothetical protein